jgi:hypothetical protein
VLPLWPAGAAPIAATRPADPAPVAGEEIHEADLLRAACLRVREPAPPTEAGAAAMAAAGALLDALAARGRGGRSPELARAAAAAAGPAARIRPGPSLRRRLRPFRTSASALAAHGQCRFLHFARHVLGLREPVRGDEEGIAPLALGNAAHAALEAWFAGGARGDVGALFDAALAAEVRGVRPGLDGRVAALRTREALAAFAAAEALRAAARPFPLRQAEAGFGAGDGFPPLVLRSRGRRIEVRGRMDRIDRDAEGRAVAVDYKVSAKGRKYGEKEHGEALAGGDPQVILYLLALRDAAGLVPAGVEIADVLAGGITGIRVDDAPGTVAPDGEAIVIPRAGIDDLAIRLGERAGAAARALARGDVTPFPRDPDRCGAGKCGYADLCRFAKGGGAEESP